MLPSWSRHIDAPKTILLKIVLASLAVLKADSQNESHWEMWFPLEGLGKNLCLWLSFLGVPCFVDISLQPSAFILHLVFLVSGPKWSYGAQHLDPVQTHLNLITFLKIPLPDQVTFAGSRLTGIWVGECYLTRQTDNGVEASASHILS